MSPERARGLQIDERTDAWSLGVVLYEMIAGRVPFEGATLSDVISSVLDKQPPPLARFAPDAPSQAQWIINKALRKNCEVAPPARTAQAAQPNDTLPTTHTTSSAEYIVSEIMRHRHAVALVLALVLVGAIAGALAWYRFRSHQGFSMNWGVQKEKMLVTSN